MDYGLLPDTRTELEKSKDYQFGGTTKIVPEVLQPDGDWTNFLPAYEYQNTNFETMACVTYSALNCIEIILNRKYGETINFSDRFTAKMSGTTSQGNTFYNVAESIRKLHGIVKQEVYTNNATSGEFYAEIPTIIKETGLQSLNTYLIQYEFVKEPLTPEVLKEALKYAPLQIGVYAYGKLVDGVYQRAIGFQPNHAVTLYKFNDVINIFDHYLGNEHRKLSADYLLSAALKFNITKKDMLTLKKERTSPDIYAIGKDGKKQMIVDMVTLDAFKNIYDVVIEEVDSLAEYPNGNTFAVFERVIH